MSSARGAGRANPSRTPLRGKNSLMATRIPIRTSTPEYTMLEAPRPMRPSMR